MATKSDNSDKRDRLAVVETEVSGFREEMRGMWSSIKDTKAAIDKITETITAASKPDYMTWIAFFGLLITLVGCLWAAAIRPIASDVERSAASSDKMATAVLVQNQKAAEEREERLKHDFELEKQLIILKYTTVQKIQ